MWRLKRRWALKVDGKIIDRRSKRVAVEHRDGLIGYMVVCISERKGA